ncbi:nicotinate phosphoribosyltransferase [Saccharopolyspora sp. NPDC050389]|uniref:nicotinate phosphoribosyltransferase n=1 Tax=Saccharopolyspora sp. NPDC050389 TaxID=3155516 RepID=UPI0033DC8463
MSGLCTDLYEIRMAASYLRRGMTGPATFSLFARKLPRDRGFLVSAGLADCLDFLQHLHFDNDELTYLADVVGLREDDLAALDEMRFTGEVWAVPEGRVVFADEPFLEVTAPIAQAQLAETALLNFVTYQSSVAAKAARCRIAAPQADLIDFAARRTHGLEAARAVARASAIVGFAGTSYVAAAREFGLPAAGTMAHSYVEAFQDERAAFGAFAEDFPLTVLQILAIDLGTETLPALALGREPAEPGLMEQPPRKRSQSVVTRRMLLRAWGIMGTVSGVLVLIAFFAVLLAAGWWPGTDVVADPALHHTYLQATTTSFAAIVLCQIGTAFAARTDRTALRQVGLTTNRLLLAGCAFEILFAAAIIYLPSLQAVFGTAPPPAWAYALMLPFPALVWGVDELYRYRGRTRSAGAPERPGAGISTASRSEGSGDVGRDGAPKPPRPSGPGPDDEMP